MKTKFRYCPYLKLLNTYCFSIHNVSRVRSSEFLKWHIQWSRCMITKCSSQPQGSWWTFGNSIDISWLLRLWFEDFTAEAHSTRQEMGRWQINTSTSRSTPGQQNGLPTSPICHLFWESCSHWQTKLCLVWLYQCSILDLDFLEARLGGHELRRADTRRSTRVTA